MLINFIVDELVFLGKGIIFLVAMVGLIELSSIYFIASGGTNEAFLATYWNSIVFALIGAISLMLAMLVLSLFRLVKLQINTKSTSENEQFH
ncbi:conserved hypothetical protein [Vibrio chagasii]|uniref:hypothetical protein n=1 Tax=Vibrio fortis TaxID=212667 RepID=UPI00338821B5|nr:conserved hypothetical protein [Vibrio chagasii]CAH7373764.1 conserved hypothetical protein [Vibrio chagasii]